MSHTSDANTEQQPQGPQLREPRLATFEEVQRRSAFQALQRSERPSWWGVDLDPARRPGVPMMAQPPRPLPNARPPERQRGEPSALMHGRTNKPMPPAFSTALPTHGLAGAVRQAAARHPDHHPSHWLLKLLGDRVDSGSYRAKKALPVLLPLAALGLYGRYRLEESKRPLAWERIPMPPPGQRPAARGPQGREHYAPTPESRH